MLSLKKGATEREKQEFVLKRFAQLNQTLGFNLARYALGLRLRKGSAAPRGK